MTDQVFVGIDTSNYTTSVAVASYGGEILANMKYPLPVASGARGLRQSDALFSHTRNLPVLMDRLREELRGSAPLAIGCSVSPRDEEGSYMPCFLAGKAAAAAMGAGLGVPVFEFSHQSGHLMAAAYSSGAVERLLSAPFGAFHVSGGTTELVLATPVSGGFSVGLLGGTKDLNAGQVIDRVGVAMGLQFPCGAEMERLAEAYSGKLPSFRVCVSEMECNLSGLENLALKFYRETQDPAAVSAYVFDAVARVLAKLTENFRDVYPEAPVLYAGGVMSNQRIRRRLEAFPDTYFAQPQFSSDNAAGIALLCRGQYLMNS